MILKVENGNTVYLFEISSYEKKGNEVKVVLNNKLRYSIINGSMSIFQEDYKENENNLADFKISYLKILSDNGGELHSESFDN